MSITSRVRELLSIHNIGQRLFAKYVLGLSQGTVSELLSKPKSWDKLTEKGRDSYRKMHAWCYDEQAIQLLKTLIPRKGELVRSMSSSPLLLKGKKSPKTKILKGGNYTALQPPRRRPRHRSLCVVTFPATIPISSDNYTSAKASHNSACISQRCSCPGPVL